VIRKDTFDYQLDGTGPLFKQINRAIAQPILSGQNLPGTRLPSEHAFMEIFNTSRMTVNRALQMLADDGLVFRHRRSGTFVASQVVEHSVMELKNIVDEVEASGASYDYQLLDLKVITTDSELAEKLQTPIGTKLVYILCRHFSDRKPILIEQRYINSKPVPRSLTEKFVDTPPGSWLLKNVPWSRAEHIISAVNANDTISKYLEITPGSACLSVDRTTWQGGIRITFVTLTYPGNKHRLVGNFAPGRQSI
jgi:GntR family histidine utilization transcriptional repressor